MDTIIINGHTLTSAEDRAPLGAPCRHCGSEDTWITVRLGHVASPVGTFSLAGAATKVSAKSVLWPYAVCDGCGHESRGSRG